MTQNAELSQSRAELSRGNTTTEKAREEARTGSGKTIPFMSY